MGYVFEINSGIKQVSTNQVEKKCKDCEEWTCITCDNEGCYQHEMECKNDPSDVCAVTHGSDFTCKDCDETTCFTCDNEKP